MMTPCKLEVKWYLSYFVTLHGPLAWNKSSQLAGLKSYILQLSGLFLATRFTQQQAIVNKELSDCER